jgi:hypothetical protein
MNCKKGGLIIQRHDELKYVLGSICQIAVGHSLVHDEPEINTSLLQENTKVKNKSTVNNNKQPSTRKSRADRGDERGDLLVSKFWDNVNATIFDMRVTYLDGPTNSTKAVDTILRQHEQEKKNKYLGPCIKARKHFTPFVVSTDGMLGPEAKKTLQRASGKIAKKWNKPYSQICNFVKTRISIGIIRASHLCIRGSRVPLKAICPRNPYWEDGTGFCLW